MNRADCEQIGHTFNAWTTEAVVYNGFTDESNEITVYRFERTCYVCSFKEVQ